MLTAIFIFQIPLRASLAIALTLLNPLRHLLVAARGVILRGLPASEVLTNAIRLMLIALVALSSAAWLFRRRME